MKYIFIVNLVEDINVNVIRYEFNQVNLTYINPIVVFFFFCGHKRVQYMRLRPLYIQENMNMIPTHYRQFHRIRRVQEMQKNTLVICPGVL